MVKKDPYSRSPDHCNPSMLMHTFLIFLHQITAIHLCWIPRILKKRQGWFLTMQNVNLLFLTGMQFWSIFDFTFSFMGSFAFIIIFCLVVQHLHFFVVFPIIYLFSVFVSLFISFIFIFLWFCDFIFFSIFNFNWICHLCIYVSPFVSFNFMSFVFMLFN